MLNYFEKPIYFLSCLDIERIWTVAILITHWAKIFVSLCGTCHYLNQCLFVVNWTFGSIFHWNWNQITAFVYQKCIWKWRLFVFDRNVLYLFYDLYPSFKHLLTPLIIARTNIYVHVITYWLNWLPSGRCAGDFKRVISEHQVHEHLL